MRTLTVILFWLVLATFSHAQTYQPPAPRPIPVGAVLVSRNHDERQNRSPGYFNHLSVYTGDGKVVESQDYSGVHEISWSEYRARPQTMLVIFPRTPELGQAAAARARSLVGLPYYRLSSVPVFRRLGYGANCVSVVEAAYGVRLRRPDDAFFAVNAFATSPPLDHPSQYQQSIPAPQGVQQ